MGVFEITSSGREVYRRKFENLQIGTVLAFEAESSLEPLKMASDANLLASLQPDFSPNFRGNQA
jgi:hypothetical protein